MAQPTLNDVHVDAALSRISVAYKNPTYIWNQVAPTINVDRESDKYYKFTQGDWFRDEAAIRAEGTRAAVSGFTLSTDSYACVEYALATKLPLRTLQNADAALDLRASKAAFVTDKVQLRMENQLASEIFTTGKWGTDKEDATPWDSSTGSTPFTDLQTAVDTIRQATGQLANTLVLGAQTWSEGLKWNPDVTDIIKYTQKGIATPDLVASALDFKKVLIGTAIYNTAAEGATPSYSDIWGKNALVMYLPDSPGLMTPSAMYTFISRPFRVRRWTDEVEEAEYVEASCIADFVLVGSGLGYFFSGIVS